MPGRSRLIALLVSIGCHGDAHQVTPDAAPDAPESGVLTVPLAGCSPYFAGHVTIGGQPFELTIDTGSASLLVAASTCAACDRDGVTPLYAPGATAMDLHQAAHEVFDLGDIGASGEIYQDAVAAGPSDRTVPVALVAISSEANFFPQISCGATPLVTQGLLGMGAADVLLTGTTGFFDQLVATGMPDVFAMRYCTSSGTLWLGGYDSAKTTGDPIYADMTIGSGYRVTPSDFAVGGESVGLPASTYAPSIVDSGGPAIVFPKPIASVIQAKIAAAPMFAQLFGDATWFADPNNCISATRTAAEIDALLPPLTVTLGPSVQIDLPATSSYIREVVQSTSRFFCPDLFGIDESLYDFGNSLLRSHVVIFDRAQHRMGFAPPTPCP